VLWGASCLASLGLTHALKLFIRRNAWLSLPPAAMLVRIAVATLTICVVVYLLTLGMSQLLYGSPVAPIAHTFYQRLSFGGQLRNQFIFMLMVHGGWVALYLSFAMQGHRFRAEVRQAQLGEALQSAELRLLRSQLNPHFLFNALNGLRSQIADEPARARDAVTQLARLLRYTLASGEEDLVSLERELEMVDDYLALESMRLAERLEVERDIDPRARQVRVPAMLVQTLAENGIKHGIAALKEGGALRLSARIETSSLVLRVENPRPADVSERAGEPAGMGIRNATERLRLLFGSRASLTLDLSRPGLAVAEVRLPA
jgi:LytS/YehU family sensor histidine kinase